MLAALTLTCIRVLQSVSVNSNRVIDISAPSLQREYELTSTSGLLGCTQLQTAVPSSSCCSCSSATTSQEPCARTLTDEQSRADDRVMMPKVRVDRWYAILLTCSLKGIVLQHSHSGNDVCSPDNHLCCPLSYTETVVGSRRTAIRNTTNNRIDGPRIYVASTQLRACCNCCLYGSRAPLHRHASTVHGHASHITFSSC